MSDWPNQNEAEATPTLFLLSLTVGITIIGFTLSYAIGYGLINILGWVTVESSQVGILHAVRVLVGMLFFGVTFAIVYAVRKQWFDRGGNCD